MYKSLLLKCLISNSPVYFFLRSVTVSFASMPSDELAKKHIHQTITHRIYTFPNRQPARQDKSINFLETVFTSRIICHYVLRSDDALKSSWNTVRSVSFFFHVLCFCWLCSIVISALDVIRTVFHIVTSAEEVLFVLIYLEKCIFCLGSPIQ